MAGSTIWTAKSMEEGGEQFVIEDRFNQATGIYYKKVSEYGNVVASETAADILTVEIIFIGGKFDEVNLQGLVITCSKNDNCVLYALEVAIDPLPKIAILSSSGELSK